MTPTTQALKSLLTTLVVMLCIALAAVAVAAKPHGPEATPAATSYQYCPPVEHQYGPSKVPPGHCKNHGGEHPGPRK